MGQKVNPKGFRLGVYADWDARWFARDKTYGDQILEDLKIRKYLDKALNRAEVGRIEIEKASDSIKVIVHSGRPGMVIGKKGQEIDTMRKEIAHLVGKRSVEVSVQEIKNPEINAVLVAKNISEQITRRISYKRAMKRAMAAGMRAGAKGVKVCCAGRLNGAEIARTEWSRVGSIPLHTLRADVDYGFSEAHTTYGIVGVKVWIYKGEYQYA